MGWMKRWCDGENRHPGTSPGSDVTCRQPFRISNESGPELMTRPVHVPGSTKGSACDKTMART